MGAMAKEIEVKINEQDVVFFKSQYGTRWSFRIGNGYYHINYLLLTDAMEYAKKVLIRNLENKMSREIKKMKRKKIT